VAKVKTALKLLFSVSFCTTEIKYDSFSKAVCELVHEVKSSALRVKFL